MYYIIIRGYGGQDKIYMYIVLIQLTYYASIIMFFVTSPMLSSTPKSDQVSQVEYLTMAKKIADAHKLLVLSVVGGVIYLPFAPFGFLIFYTIFFSVVAVTPFFYKGKCPLTLWEKAYMSKGGQELYDTSFIPHYFPFITPVQVYIGKALIALALITVWVLQ